MIRIYFYILLFIPCLVISQDHILRVETIDVIKDYKPIISNGNKISSQPVYNDSLPNKTFYEGSIINKDFIALPKVLFDLPLKLRFSMLDEYYSNFAQITLGSYNHLETKLKYSNGISSIHNSGFLFHFNRQQVGFKKPYFKSFNGQLNNIISVYSNRFFDTKVLKFNVDYLNSHGLYWGGLDNYDISMINHYSINNLSLNFGLQEQSNEHLLDFINFNANYFANNFSRSELLFSGTFHFKREKSLKKQLLSIEFVSSHNNFTDFNLFNFTNYNDYFPVESINDILISHNFNYTGNYFVDYEIGYNINYFISSIEANNSFLFSPNFHISKLIIISNR